MPHSEDENAPLGGNAPTEEESLVVTAVGEIDDLFVTPPAATVHSADEFDAAQMQRTTHFILGRVIYERFQEDGLVSPVPEFTVDLPSTSRGSGDDVPEIAPPPYNFHPTQIIPGSGEVSTGGGGTTLASGFAHPPTGHRHGGFEPLFPEMFGKEGKLKGRSQAEISVDDQQLLDRVSLTLVDIAGEVDRRYSSMFDRLFEELRAAGGFTWQNFRNVATHVIRSGAEITWGRIVVLIAFGLRIAYRLLQENTPSVLRDLVWHLTNFMYDNNVLLWIWQYFGGWTAVLAIVPRNMLSFRDLGYLGLGMMTVLGAAFFLARFQRR